MDRNIIMPVFRSQVYFGRVTDVFICICLDISLLFMEEEGTYRQSCTVYYIDRRQDFCNFRLVIYLFAYFIALTLPALQTDGKLIWQHCSTATSMNDGDVIILG